MSKPKPPTPPDPKDTSAAQTGTNIGTSIANNTMGMVDQSTPYGGLTYSQIGTSNYTDPYTGKTYAIPKYKATTTLTPQQQATLDESMKAQTNLAEIANQQSGFLKDYLGTPANFDTSAAEGRLAELGRARLDPLMSERRAGLETRLANKGIAPGSEAYNREMALMGQQENDAYNQLFLTGRGQAMGELLTQRNQPINEIAALLSGSQVSNPAVSMMQPQGAATTDVAGLINQNYNQRYSNYQTAMNQQQGLLGGLFGLGSAAITGGLF